MADPNDGARLSSFPPAVRLRIAAALVEQGRCEHALALVSSVRDDLAIVVHLQASRATPAAPEAKP